MNASARFAETDFPAEVEDLLSIRDPPPTCAAVAGYAIVASATSPHALIFAIAAGSELDPVAVPLQRHASGSAPSLAIWPASLSSGTLHSMGIAVLTKDAVLRVYRSVDVRQQGRPRCDQVRVGSALASSAGVDSALAALRVVRSVSGGLFILGTRGSAAFVREVGGRLEVKALGRGSEGERSSLTFGKMFYSAIRSFGGGGSWDTDWVQGEGLHEIVACVPMSGDPDIICVKRGGVVERWGEDGLWWSFNVFDFLGGRDSYRKILCADVTSDDTAVFLVQSTSSGDSGHKIVTFNVRSMEEVPGRTEMIVPLNGGEAGVEVPCLMVLSGDIAYFYIHATRTVAWLSVARGVSSEGQVQGSTTLESEMSVLTVVNASFGLSEAAATGGVAAFIHSAGVWLVSSAVPAPMSLDRDTSTPALTSIKDGEPVFWRTLLQYCADQKGATKASLRGLVSSLRADGFDVSEGLSELVERTSRRIITSDHDPGKSATDLLIDMELKRREQQHRVFVRLLADADVFSEVRPDAPSMTEDRLWNAISASSRYTVMTDGEKLSSSRRIRELENRYSSGRHFHRFDKAFSASFLGNEQVKGSRTMWSQGTDIRDETSFIEGSNVLAEALVLVGSDISTARRGRTNDDLTTRLYRNPQEFHKFLPALDRCLSDALTKLDSEHGMLDDDGAADGSSIYCRKAQNALLLSCEAAIEVVRGSREAREAVLEILEAVPGGMDGIQNSMFATRTCGNVLTKIAQKALEMGARSKESERGPTFRAAVLVVDEFLSQISCDESADSSQDVRVEGQTTPCKRMRLDAAVLSRTERRDELRHVLDMLRRSGLDEDAFRLAEKYNDFGTMLSLRVSSPEFDAFMERSLEKFGDDFAFFSFQWLEKCGELRLLLRGQNFGSRVEVENPFKTRTERMNTLLAVYFRRDRCKYSNLSWIHWISQGNFNAATKSLISQTKKMSVPGKKGSAINTVVLSSIAKLSLLARDNSGRIDGADRKNMSEYISGRLILSKLHDIVEAGNDALSPADELIRRFIDDFPVTSESLAQRVVMATEALQFSCMNPGELQVLQDYVWKRCIERQSDIWIPIAKKIAITSDDEMRRRLTGTALYKAATQVTFTESKMDDMIGRGFLESSEFSKQNCLPEVTTLMRAAVSLAIAT